MRRVAFVLFVWMLMIAGAARAQQQVTPIVPFSTPTALTVVTPDANDARASSCSASSLPNLMPYVVRPGDHLADLIANESAVTVTQLAALNCLDDPDALPVGAVIWIPALASAASATQQATAAATAQSTDEATDEAATAQIESFRASAASISNTATVTLSWSSSGSKGTSAYFYLCAVDACVRPQNSPPVLLNGLVSFSNFQSSGTYRYRLDVDGVTQDASVQITCAQTWLGGVGASPRCPEDPALSVYGVWQPFEHGVMIWFSDTKQIYVMTDDGQLRVYEDHYVDGQPAPGEQAPKDRFTPTRGFGLIWQALGADKSPLGWALKKEVGFDSARQAAGHTSYTTYIQGPDSVVYAVTQLPGQATGYWAQIAS